MPYTTDWKPVKLERPDRLCKECNSDNVWYRLWESSDGGHEDVHYHCRGCNRNWWVEGTDY
jgi:transposase-like protein